MQARHGRDAAGHAIEQAMADIAEGLVQSGVRRLVVAGGETSGAVVDRLRIPGFLVGAEIAAGVPVLRAVGAKGGEMLLALKSGNFGGPEFFSGCPQADALNRRSLPPFINTAHLAARDQSVVNSMAACGALRISLNCMAESASDIGYWSQFG